MGLSNLLLSAFLAPISIPSFESNSETCSLIHDPLKVILYESYIPIDALTFIIGTEKMSKSEVNKVVGSILEAKQSILTNPENAAKVFNLSETINEKEAMKSLIYKRLNLIKNDKSLIFNELIRNKHDEILKCADKVKNKKLKDPGLNRRYKEMVHRIYEAIYDNLDINEVLTREKDELYRDFARGITKSEIKKARISLSLGSSIFYLPMLVNLISKINVKDKDKFIRDWANIFFDPIEKLAISTSSKNFIEQKYIVKEFIKNGIEPGPANNAFEARTIIIKAFDLDNSQIRDLSNRQNKENSKILKIVENMTEIPWIVKYNKEIKEDMITYLLTMQPSDKKKLLNHFEY
jgi:hypothetical protein